MAPESSSPPRVASGRVVMTAGVNDLVQRGALDPTSFLQRHLRGDWGEISESMWQSNDAALTTGRQLFSSYQITANERLWIITTRHPHVTTLLLPSES